MSLEATLIRKQVAQILRDAGSTLFEQRVFRDRTRPLRESELPAVLVYMTRGTAELESEGHPRIYRNETELVTEVVVSELGTPPGFGDAAEAADAVGEEVLQALFQDEGLGGCARDIQYSGFDSGGREEGDITVGVLQLRWQVEYALDAPAHRTAPDLDEVNITAEIGGDGSPVEEMAVQIDQSAEA